MKKKKGRKQRTKINKTLKRAKMYIMLNLLSLLLCHWKATINTNPHMKTHVLSHIHLDIHTKNTSCGNA